MAEEKRIPPEDKRWETFESGSNVFAVQSGSTRFLSNSVFYSEWLKDKLNQSYFHEQDQKRLTELESEISHCRETNKQILQKHSNLSTFVSVITGKAVVLPRMRTREAIAQAMADYNTKVIQDYNQKLTDVLPSEIVFDVLKAMAEVIKNE